MTGALKRPLHGLFVLLAVLALAVAACSSGSSPAKSNAPGATKTPAAGQTQPAGATEQPEATEPDNGGDGNGLSGAVDKLSAIKSYKFTIVMKGGTYGEMLGSDPISGTVITSPVKAAEMSVMGMVIREVDGKKYIKMGASWIASDDNSSSMVDDFAPAKMFGSYITGSTVDGYKPAGEEKKNGVQTVHYKADATILNAYSSMMGVKGNATWSADVWIAKDGGYPVSTSITATGGDTDFVFSMDITNVNDPANKVEKPSL